MFRSTLLMLLGALLLGTAQADDEPNFAKMRTKELRQFLAARGLKCSSSRTTMLV
jgi:hypothetical protein